MIDKNIFMERAFQLASLGKGSVSPNPLVGCVIVHDDLIIGEGYHQKHGEAHAEVNAVNQVENKGLLKDSEVFVTLEPCAHFGKTPPCADLLINHQVKKVFVANLDPNPLVAGKGIEKLEAAGIIVETGLLKEKGKLVNRRFFKFMIEKRPYIILKWAETSDGFVARKNFDSKWISNSYSRQLVHKWRAEEDAIMVGTNTAKHDNPQLNVRRWRGSNPVRVVIDKQLRLSKDLHLFSDGEPTICFNQKEDKTDDNVVYVKLTDKPLVSQVMDYLYTIKMQSIIIEGGSVLLNTFLTEGIWDEARVFTSDNSFGEGIPSPDLKGKKNANLVEEINVEGDRLSIYRKN